MIRFLDVLLSGIGLVFLSPVLVLISLAIALESRGGVFFAQVRVGQEGRPFHLLKFRTMRPASERQGQLTIGNKDPRITRAGGILRRYKLDELPQLVNVLIGDMSLVGPWPEVPKYVALYTEEQRRVLSVKPGITDRASLEYFEENELLARSENPERTYVLEVMPHKLALNMDFVDHPTLAAYFSVIARTVLRVFQ